MVRWLLIGPLVAKTKELPVRDGRTYYEKLQDPRWQRRRLEIMQRDRFRCLACGDSKNTLNVHHMAYHSQPWLTPNDLLETLCVKCHKNRTEINKLLEAIPTRRLFESLARVRELKAHIANKDAAIEALIKECLIGKVIEHESYR